MIFYSRYFFFSNKILGIILDDSGNIGYLYCVLYFNRRVFNIYRYLWCLFVFGREFLLLKEGGFCNRY